MYYWRALPRPWPLLGLFWIILRLSGDIHTNPGPKRDFKILYSNVRGLSANINHLKAASTKYDLVLCSETIASEFRHNAELLIPEFNKPWHIRRGALPRARGMSVYVRSGFTASRHKEAECGCHEVMVVRVCSRYNNFYIYSCYRNPDLDDSIFDCLKASMATVHERDRKSCFLFFGDFNVHHREWLQSRSATDRHGIAAYDFTNETGCTQLVGEPTHISGNCLDLLITDAPGVCRVSVQPQIGSSDHFAVSAKVQLNSPLPDFTVSRKVNMLSRVNWDTLSGELLSVDWKGIIDYHSPAEKFNEVVGGIISRHVPTKLIKLRSRDRPWFNEECRVAFNRKQASFHRWTRQRSPDNWEVYRRARNAATLIFNRAESTFNLHLRGKLNNTKNIHAWWKNLKFSLFGVEQSSTPIKRPDGSLTFVAAEKAKILADYFNSKMYSNDIIIPSGCFPIPKLNSLAFRSSELLNILQNLEENGTADCNGMFPAFFKRFSNILAPKLAVLYRRLVQLGNFPDCWKIASVTPIPKEGCSCLPKDYRPISITPILSKVFEKLLARRLKAFMAAEGILPKTQFGYRSGLGTADALLTLNTDFQDALNNGMEVRAVAIDFSAAFDKVNHKGIIYNLQNIGVGGKFLALCKSFLTGRQQFVTVDGSRSPTSGVHSGVPQGSVLGPLMFTLYTSSLLAGLKCNNIAYADDTTIYVIIRKPVDRASSALKLNEDLVFIEDWCGRWGMELNALKTKSMLFSRSRTILPEHPDLTLMNTTIESVETMKLLGVVFDSKLTYEQHLRKVTSIASQKVGILRKCWRVYEDDELVKKCFYAFVLPFFEYCSSVWLSAAPTHLNMLQRVFTSAEFIARTHLSLEHRRHVAALCHFYKIFHSPEHPMHSRLPPAVNPVRRTRRTQRMNTCALTSALSPNTVQFNRSFLPFVIEAWNFLPQGLVDSSTMDSFKRRVNRHLLE